MRKTQSTAKRAPGRKTAMGRDSGVVSSRIRAIGNSRGVILSNQLIDKAGISPDGPIDIRAEKGMIVITASKKVSRVNTDLGSWDNQFKVTMREGNNPDRDLWE